MPHTRACPMCGGKDVRAYLREESFRIVKCTNCGLVYLGNPPEESTLYEEYHAGPSVSVEDYAAESANASLRSLFQINRQRAAVIRSVQPSARSLLDVGCGRGFFLKTARGWDFDAVGIDVSHAAVAEAKRTLGVHAAVKSLSELSSEGASFDVITLWHVLEHFNDPLPELGRIRKLLNPGGSCFLEVPNLNSIKFRFSRRKWHGGNHPRYHRTFFTASTLRRMLEAAGFSAIERIPITYRTGRKAAYELAAATLNRVGLDAFLFFRAG